MLQGDSSLELGVFSFIAIESSEHVYNLSHCVPCLTLELHLKWIYIRRPRVEECLECVPGYDCLVLVPYSCCKLSSLWYASKG
jgi:hypothetical protein